MYKKFLPVGSVVKIKSIDQRVMIVGFMQKQSDTEKMWDYSAVLFPNGMIDSQNVILFNGDAIERVYFIGLQDVETFSFMQALVKKVDELEEASKSQGE